MKDSSRDACALGTEAHENSFSNGFIYYRENSFLHQGAVEISHNDIYNQL